MIRIEQQWNLNVILFGTEGITNNSIGNADAI